MFASLARYRALRIGTFPFAYRGLKNITSLALRFHVFQRWLAIHRNKSIMDNGPGIPAVEIEKIFERFYRIPGSKGNGCGLGLAIVKEIADLHHAALKLSPLQAETFSRAGGGLRIEVCFAQVQLL